MKNVKTLHLNSTNEFVNFLKRFTPISSSLLIEIENGFLKAKTHTPERSVVKFSKIELPRIFKIDPEENLSAKIGLYSIDRMIKAFNHFGNDVIEFDLHQEKSSEGNVGTEIHLKNETLDINFQCATLRLFTYITDEMMERIADKSAAQVSFVLTKEMQSQINSLANMDVDHKLLTIGIKKGKVTVSGKSFTLNLLDIENQSDIKISVYKNQFTYLDKEDTMVYLNEDRLIFHSIESDTKMIIGRAE